MCIQHALLLSVYEDDGEDDGDDDYEHGGNWENVIHTSGM